MTEQQQELFHKLYDNLIDSETTFKTQCTEFCTGGNIKVKDIDTSFQNMKKYMKQIRKLAIEVNDENR